MNSIQTVVVESTEDRTYLAECLLDFALAMRARGIDGCDRAGDYTRARAAWYAATGELLGAEALARLCNEHNKPGLACG